MNEIDDDLYSLALTLSKLCQHLSENNITLEDAGVSISNEDIWNLYGK